MTTQYAVIVTGMYYPSVKEFATAEEAQKGYLLTCNDYKHSPERIQVMLVKIDKRRKYGKVVE